MVGPRFFKQRANTTAPPHDTIPRTIRAAHGGRRIGSRGVPHRGDSPRAHRLAAFRDGAQIDFSRTYAIDCDATHGPSLARRDRVLRWTTSLLVVFVTGCAYQPGALLAHGRRTASSTTGCVDVAVEWTHRDWRPDLGPVLTYSIGNRCQHPVHMALDRVSAVGVSEEGGVDRFQAFDPNRELEAYILEPRHAGSFSVQFMPVDAVERTLPPVICADVQAFDVSAAAAHSPRWVCVGRERDATVVAGNVP
jgi:hypothetical protein